MPHSHLHPSQRRMPPPPPLNLQKSSTARTSRPVLHRRGTPISISKLGPGYQKRSEKVTAQPWDMTSSFLNFCATCEKQILVPDNSLLYCSESCRREDSAKPLSASSSVSSISPPITPPSTPPIHHPIVAPMTPTRPDNTPMQLQSHRKSDHDPTLSIHPPTPTTPTPDSLLYEPPLHGEYFILPGIRHSSSVSLSAMSATAPLPPLGHSPSTVASSLDSNASDNMRSTYGSDTRPLPPRHNRCVSGGPGTKSVDLVVPHVELANGDMSGDDDDRGSIFPASSSVWEDGH